MTLRLKWRRPRPDQPKDFAALDSDGNPVGRVYYRCTGAPGMHGWAWFGHGGTTQVSFGSGDAETKMEACEDLERAYFARRDTGKKTAASPEASGSN
jgi:hypothetical protein